MAMPVESCHWQLCDATGSYVLPPSSFAGLGLIGINLVHNQYVNVDHTHAQGVFHVPSLRTFMVFHLPVCTTSPRRIRTVDGDDVNDDDHDQKQSAGLPVPTFDRKVYTSAVTWVEFTHAISDEEVRRVAEKLIPSSQTKTPTAPKNATTRSKLKWRNMFACSRLVGTSSALLDFSFRENAGDVRLQVKLSHWIEKNHSRGKLGSHRHM